LAPWACAPLSINVTRIRHWRCSQNFSVSFLDFPCARASARNSPPKAFLSIRSPPQSSARKWRNRSVPSGARICCRAIHSVDSWKPKKLPHWYPGCAARNAVSRPERCSICPAVVRPIDSIAEAVGARAKTCPITPARPSSDEARIRSRVTPRASNNHKNASSRSRLSPLRRTHARSRIRT
jgi:hypothetical protein